MVADSGEFTEIPLDSSTPDLKVNEATPEPPVVPQTSNGHKQEGVDKPKKSEPNESEIEEDKENSTKEPEEETSREPKEEPKEESTEVPKEEPKKESKEESKKEPKEDSKKDSKKEPSEQPNGSPADTLKDDIPTPSEEHTDPVPGDNTLKEPKTSTPNRKLSVSSHSSNARSRSASVRRTQNSNVALARHTVSGTESQPAKVFIQNAFEKIKGSKDAKRIPALQTATDWVLDQFERRPEVLPPVKKVLEPLELICVPPGSSNELKEVALDTLGQLFSLNYIGIVEDEAERAQLLSDAVNIVWDSWEAEAADQRVEVQIIKALTSAVVNEDTVLHGSALLRAVRLVYRIFVITRTSANQNLAQVSLTQMVQAVFERVKVKSTLEAKQHRREKSSLAVEDNGDTSSNAIGSGAAGPSGGSDSGDATLTLQEIQNTPLPELEDSSELHSELENTVQDACALFRTLCKLSMKPIDESDVRSQNMRSKLLSLHLMHSILKHFISIFKNKRLVVRKSGNQSEPFAYAVKPYLRQTLAQNALSQAPALFEITTEIFWLILSNLRSEFKPEIAVFFTDVYYTAMDLRTATMHQKLYFMTILSRMCTDPRLLVEMYLNYDCQSNSPNVFEKMMDLISRLALNPATEPTQPLTRMSIDRQQIKVYDLNASPRVAITNFIANAAAGNASPNNADHDAFLLKMAAVDAMVNVLNSLVLWSQRGDGSGSGSSNNNDTAANDGNTSSHSIDKIKSDDGQSSQENLRHRVSSSTTSLGSVDQDDPDQFANRKRSKRVLDAAIQEFNYNPSRGIQKLAEGGFIANAEDPEDVAKFLLNAEGLDKAKLGEYLGKNDDFNLQVMAQFVKAMNLKGLSLPEALRKSLQRFRLPGEGQVVDRYMHTIADKYYADNAENDVHPDFASPDTAWVLAMSIVMLNTDLHSGAMRRKRMSSDDFVKNNRGMNDGSDFREDMLREYYDEIHDNEIKLQSEQEQHAIRDETYDVASDVITNRAAQLFNSSPISVSDYYNASHAAHIRPMFELSWLAVLAGLSNPFNQLKDHLALRSCLKGLELALSISASYDVEIARVSFVQTLAQATLLSYPNHMQWKNLGALRALLNVAVVEGDSLRESWYPMLVIISQLEQLQLLIRGGAHNSSAATQGTLKLPPRDISEALVSREFVVDIDRIFTNSQSMTNSGAVEFVKALSRVSLEDIASSRDSGDIRFFALQKMVDVCYYNSSRIRMGWSELWDAAMAEQFAKVLVDKNNQVVMFALDSLRQLSMRFLDIEEMPHFAFQQKFLQPFSHALRHNSNPSIKVLVLECLTQLVMTRSANLKSGWGAIFSAVKAAAESNNLAVVEAAYNLLKTVPLDKGVPEGFLGACSAIAEQSEAKNALRAVSILKKLVENNLGDMEMLQRIFVVLSSIAMTGRDPEARKECLDVLFGLLNKYGERFTRDDWNEVFTHSLSPLFSRLHDYRRRATRSPARSPTRSPVRNRSPARTPTRSPTRSPARSHYASHSRRPSDMTPVDNSSNPKLTPLSTPVKSTDNIARQDRLQIPRHAHFEPPYGTPERARSPSSREDWSMWLSTTLMQALVSIIDLFNAYFDMLEHALDPFFLELLRTCILQENDPVSRKGVYCLEFLIQSNAERFTAEHWSLVVSKIVQLFKDTTATTLMDRSIIEGPMVPDAAGLFRGTIAKTVQALLVISSVREMLIGSPESQKIFNAMPIKEILRLTTRLRMSYEFAHEFNSQHELRHALYERGFVRHTPNLLHQESTAAQTYISISMRLFRATDRFATDPSARQDVSEELMQLCDKVMRNYNRLHQHAEQRHIEKLLPIVRSILQHVNQFDDEDFKQLVPSIYLQVIDILNKDMPQDFQDEVQHTLRRAADVWILNKTATK